MNRLWPLVDEPETRPHRAYVPLDQTLLFELLHPPAGMDVVGVFYDPVRRTVNFVVDHSALPAVAPGDLLPALYPIFTIHHQEPSQRIEADWKLPNPSANPGRDNQGG